MFSPLLPRLPRPERPSNEPFSGSIFLESRLSSLDWLASIFEAKILAQKTKICKQCTRTNANTECILLMAVTRQPIELECCSNPLKMGKVL